MSQKWTTKRVLLLLAVFALAGTQGAAAPNYLNEWLFDLDDPGLTLSQAINSGTDGAAFSADSASVTQTDGTRDLVCSNNVPGAGALWTDGAVLNADVTNQSAGVRFLRYDLEYDLTSTNNNSGTLLGLGFVDASGTNLSMVALEYAQPGTELSPDITETEVIGELALTGTMTVIAKVDLGSQTIEVWYDLTGSNSFSGSPNQTASIRLANIDELQFRATGDLLPSLTRDSVRMDNLRTAATWAEIIEPVEDLDISPELSVSISDSLGGTLVAGETSLITVVVTNSADAATDVFTTLTHNGGSGLSIVSSNNAPAPLGTGETLTNTYEVAASLAGEYILQTKAFSAEADSDTAVLNLRVIPVYELSTNAVEIVVATEGSASAVFTLQNNGSFSASYSISDDAGVPWVSNTVEQIGDFIITNRTTGITYTPDSGTVGGASSQQITMDVDAAGQLPGTTELTATVVWGNGLSDEIDVTIVVTDANPLLTVIPESLEFEGPAGFVTQTNLTVRNDGNITLSYRTENLNALTNGYVWTNTTCQWETVYQQDVNDYPFAVGTDTGTTPWIPLGFPFLYHGVAYTQMTVSVDGEIGLADGQILGPYQGDLVFDSNSDIRWYGDENHMAVTWDAVGQKSGAEDLTFQAILYRNGTIRFQYLELSDDTQWPDTAIGLESSGYSTEASLVRGPSGEDAGTVTYTTNYTVVTNGWNGDFPITEIVGTNVVVEPYETIRRQALRFVPAVPIVITCSPETGTLAPGESRGITVFGNAAGLTPGGVNDVVADTLFSFATQPEILVSLAGEGAGEFDWINTKLDGSDVFGVFQLRKQVGGVAVPPFSTKPNAVYTDGVLSQEEEVYAPELAGDFLFQGNKWSWAPNNSGEWNTIHIRLPWAGESLRDPDIRAANAELTLQAQPVIAAEVQFTAINSVEPFFLMADQDADGVADLLEWTAGTDANSADSIFAVTSRQNPDGSRTLSWSMPHDALNRAYTVWYATSLNGPWNPIAILDNLTSYIDTDEGRNAEPVVFYKISVSVQ